MILGVEKELSVFVQAVLAGNMVYLVYSAIRVIRRLIRHNLLFVSLEDLFFWIGTGIYLFSEMYQNFSSFVNNYNFKNILRNGVKNSKINLLLYNSLGI